VKPPSDTTPLDQLPVKASEVLVEAPPTLHRRRVVTRMLHPLGHGAAILCLVAPPWLPQAPEPIMRRATLLAGGGRELPDPLGDMLSANRSLACP
jgi:hypothetical protein